MTATITLTLEPRIELPAEETESGILTRALLVENVTPERRNYIASETLLHAVDASRDAEPAEFGPQYFGAGKIPAPSLI